MRRLTFTTSQKREIIDITDNIAERIPAGSGALTVFVQHTTAAVTAMDLDPGTDLDFLEFLAAITPDIQWRHPHDPAHAPDHMLAGLIGPSLTVPYEEGRLLLGSWQRIVLVECDGPRERSLVLHIYQSSR